MGFYGALLPALIDQRHAATPAHIASMIPNGHAPLEAEVQSAESTTSRTLNKMTFAPRSAVSRTVQHTGTTGHGHARLKRAIDRARCAMPEISELLLAACMFLGAALYTSVGHAGASAYIALMALLGIAPAVMRPTALALNILVAAFTSFRYLWAGLFRWRTLWPFLIGAIPFAFIGGAIQLPGQFYRPLVGVILLIAGVRFLWPKELTSNREPRAPPITARVACGAIVGLLSGLTGTGGGIFLSPILLFSGWSDTRTASGVAAVFILCNSIAGLLGNVAIVKALPPNLPIYVAAVLVGAG
jgi:uncharacterized membrane protein YfcA